MEYHFWIWSAFLVLDSTIDANSFNQIIIVIKNTVEIFSIKSNICNGEDADIVDIDVDEAS